MDPVSEEGWDDRSRFWPITIPWGTSSNEKANVQSQESNRRLPPVIYLLFTLNPRHYPAP
jgi:hypothetical protein